MADDKLKTGPEPPGPDRPGDAPAKEAPPIQEPTVQETDAPGKTQEPAAPGTGPALQAEQSVIPGMGEDNPARSALGEVVVDFDKINELINHSGWDVGRLGAQGLLNICTRVSSSNARPGDLIFFQGTDDTPGVSHVGIYVGNGIMIHCGDPISYANINTSYWQSHFLAFGRLP